MDSLLQIIGEIWHADEQMKERSLLGESELDRQARRTRYRFYGFISLAIIVIGGLIYWKLRN